LKDHSEARIQKTTGKTGTKVPQVNQRENRTTSGTKGKSRTSDRSFTPNLHPASERETEDKPDKRTLDSDLPKDPNITDGKNGRSNPRKHEAKPKNRNLP
jgi:hypothetical protein